MELAYMEHTAAWAGPLEFQPAATNWTADEGPAGDDQAQAYWAGPAAGHPLEYASIVDIFGSSCSLQPYAVPASSYSSGGGQQQLVLVEPNYYNDYAAAAQHDGCGGPVGKATATQEDLLSKEQLETYINNPEKLFQKTMEKVEDDAKLLKRKMHRYPPSIRALDDGGLYTAPRVVAIGPYHHCDGEHLMEAEKMKHVAAIQCMKKSSLQVQEMYQEVVSVAEKIKARGLYDDKDVMAGMGYEDEFLPMMFYDACFLVMYMLEKSKTWCEQVLFDFFESNDNDIAHDIMLLENQIPWPVVDAVMRMCTIYPLEKTADFIANCKDGSLQDRVFTRLPPVDLDQDYYDKAPHLLGLIRFYVVGKRTRRSSKFKLPVSEAHALESIQISAGAIELAEMGIFLEAKEDEAPVDMGLDTKWIILAKLPVAPLSLNDLRASRLINMAALELCMTPYFFDFKAAKPEDSAVCSYLLLLSMLMHSEADVQELRKKSILQGAGLSNNKTLDFFNRFQSLRKGRCHAYVMVEIEHYRMTRWRWWLWLYKFVYHNWKIIAGIVSFAGAVAGIIGKLSKLKGAQ